MCLVAIGKIIQTKLLPLLDLKDNKYYQETGIYIPEVVTDSNGKNIFETKDTPNPPKYIVPLLAM